MYLQNKYTHWYYNVIQQAQSRIISGYTEKHHIIPKSLGGTNQKENLVALTAREHFVCHLLLTKMTENEARSKMSLAVFYLTGNGKAKRNNVIKDSRLYENLRKENAKYVSKQKKGCKQPPRSNAACINYSNSKTGILNPNFKCKWITPWGIFESTRLAAKHCPEFISSGTILNFCQKKNSIPINYLSVCRSRGYLNKTHIGSTPAEIGFSISTVV